MKFLHFQPELETIKFWSFFYHNFTQTTIFFFTFAVQINENWKQRGVQFFIQNRIVSLIFDFNLYRTQIILENFLYFVISPLFTKTISRSVPRKTFHRVNFIKKISSAKIMEKIISYHKYFFTKKKLTSKIGTKKI